MHLFFLMLCFTFSIQGFCLKLDNYKECPEGLLEIESISDFDPKRINSTEVTLYIISNINQQVMYDLKDFNKGTFSIIGANSTLVQLVLKFSTDCGFNLMITNATLIPVNENIVFDHIYFRNVTMYTQLSLVTKILDSDLYSLSQFNGITAEFPIFDITLESYLPIRNVVVDISFQRICHYNINGFASDINFFSSKIDDTLTFYGSSNSLRIRKINLAGSQCSVTINQVIGNKTLTFNFINIGHIEDLPTFYINLFNPTVFVLPSVPIQLYYISFYINVFSSSKIYVGYNGHAASINCSAPDQDITILLTESSSQLGYLSQTCGCNIIIDKMSEITRNFDIKTFEIIQENQSLFSVPKSDINVIFHEIDILSFNPMTKYEFKGKCHFYLNGILTFFGTDIYFDNLEANSDASIIYSFLLDNSGQITINDPLIAYQPLPFILQYIGDEVPEDKIVFKYIKNNITLFKSPELTPDDLDFYLSNTNTVDGFVPNLVLTTISYYKRESAFKLGMMDYPSKGNSFLCFAQDEKNCPNNSFILTNNNFDRWVTRIAYFTYKFSIFLDQSMPEDLYFDFENVSYSIDISIKSKNITNAARLTNPQPNSVLTFDQVEATMVENETTIDLELKKIEFVNEGHLSNESLNRVSFDKVQRITTDFSSLKYLKDKKINKLEIIVPDQFISFEYDVIWYIQTLDQKYPIQTEGSGTNVFFEINSQNITVNKKSSEPINESISIEWNREMSYEDECHLVFTGNWGKDTKKAFIISSNNISNLNVYSKSPFIPLSIQNDQSLKITTNTLDESNKVLTYVPPSYVKPITNIFKQGNIDRLIFNKLEFKDIGSCSLTFISKDDLKNFAEIKHLHPSNISSISIMYADLTNDLILEPGSRLSTFYTRYNGTKINMYFTSELYPTLRVAAHLYDDETLPNEIVIRSVGHIEMENGEYPLILALDSLCDKWERLVSFETTNSNMMVKCKDDPYNGGRSLSLIVNDTITTPKKINAGLVAAIAIAVIAVLIIIGIIVFLVVRKKQAQAADDLSISLTKSFNDIDV